MFKRLAAVAAVALTGLAFTQTPAAANNYDPFRITGRVSYYGPPYEGAGITATGESSAQAGFASRVGPFGRSYCVTLNRGRLHAILRRIDYGPASWTGRAIDITGAGVQKFEGRGSVQTDASVKARLLPSKKGPAWNCGVR